MRIDIDNAHRDSYFHVSVRSQRTVNLPKLPAPFSWNNNSELGLSMAGLLPFCR